MWVVDWFFYSLYSIRCISDWGSEGYIYKHGVMPKLGKRIEKAFSEGRGVVSAFYKAISLYIVDWIVWVAYPVLGFDDWRKADIYKTGEKAILARRLQMSFQHLGSTFIKVGQLVSMLPVLPRSFTSEFANLCDYIPPEDFSTIKKLMKDELGKPAEEVFEYIDPEPIGAGSLAQVHCAVLKDGSDAVVKVQRPGLKDRFDTDFAIIVPIGNFLDSIIGIISKIAKSLEGFSPGEILTGYALATSVDELDFGLEATVQQMYYNAIAKDGLYDDLHCPTVYWDYTTDHLITMERIWFYFKLVDIDVGSPEGIEKTLSFMKCIGHNPPLALKRCHRAWWWPYTRYGVLNEDVHHGNFLFHYDGTIAIVDFGLNVFAGACPESDPLRPVTLGFWKGIMSGNILFALRSAITLMPGMAPDLLKDKEIMKIISTEGMKVLNPIMNIHKSDVLNETEKTGGFITDFNTYLRTGDFYSNLLGTVMSLLPKIYKQMGSGLDIPYDVIALLRMIPYWATWMQIVDPTWDLFGEGDSLNGYWFGPNDGKIPYKGIEPVTYPEPPLPYLPKVYFEKRSPEQLDADFSEIARPGMEIISAGEIIAKIVEEHKELNVTLTKKAERALLGF